MTTIRERGIEHITQIKLRDCEANLLGLQEVARRSAERLMTGLNPDYPLESERMYLAVVSRIIEDTERQIAEHRATLASLLEPP